MPRELTLYRSTPEYRGYCKLVGGKKYGPAITGVAVGGIALGVTSYFNWQMTNHAMQPLPNHITYGIPIIAGVGVAILSWFGCTGLKTSRSYKRKKRKRR